MRCTVIGFTAFLHAFIIQGLPQVTEQVTEKVIPLAAATSGTATASAYPTPTTNEFLYLNFDQSVSKDKGAQLIIHSAFEPFSDIMSATFQSIGDTNDDTMTRWFSSTITKNNSQDSRAYIRGVFARIFSPPISPQDHVATWVANNADISNACTASTKAYTIGAAGVFHVCQPGLDQAMIMSQANCSVFGDNIDRTMMALSGTLIREFMHMQSIGDDAPSSVGNITDVIYGPSNCFRMAHARSDVNRQKAFINADSYRWFATNAYYNSVCHRSFGDPAVDTEEEFNQDMQETQSSLNYGGDALQEGIFDGV